jgi:hypothetical protein
MHAHDDEVLIACYALLLDAHFSLVFQEKVHMTGLVGDDGMKGKKQFYY